MSDPDRTGASKLVRGLAPLFVSALLIVSGMPASAARLTSSYRLAGGAPNCSLVQSGDGAAVGGSINETDCDVVSGSSGSFTLTGGAQASFGVVRASAGVDYQNLARASDVYALGSVIAGSSFDDRITLDAAGRTGEVVDLVFDIALSGDAHASITGSNPQLFGQASGVLNVEVNGKRVRASQSAFSGSNKLIDNTGPGTVQITLGTDFYILGALEARASLDSFSGGFTGANGVSSAAFGNSGGITSFALYDANGLAINGFSMSSESGQFQFYNPIPEPNTALLLGIGLTALGIRRKGRGE